MSKDPFAEPFDAERTVIRPRPSGVAGGRVVAAAASDTGPQDARPVPKTGTNPLVAAIRRFESEAVATGLEARSLRAARYALCATVDDMVLSTPWGSTSSWSQQSMTSIFHNEVTGGERFFEILEQMQQDLGHHEPVVELMYLCMSLGFAGRYRVMPRGVAALTELTDGVYRTIRQRRGDFERELSPQWRGVAAGARPLAQRVPLWAMGLGTACIAAIMYVAFTYLLANESEVAFAELFALPPRGQATVPHQPLPPPPPAPAAAPTPLAAAPVSPPPDSLGSKLRQFLAPEIKAGLVQVLEDAQATTVRVTNRNMFGSGEATLAASAAPLIGHIGDALNDEPGNVSVYGFTDDQPIHTPRFPSNFELSQARADAVAALLRTHLKDAARLHAKGKGQSDPIASNATADGRQQNRRTEIVLVRASNAM
jgi:type VI secretion system protein ImpK